MPYIGQQPTSTAFITDSFNGDGTTTAFTMSVAPAGPTSVLVAVSGVLQSPSTYAVVGTTLTFSAAPPTGTSNISARYLGIPASGVTTTAYRTITEFTATAGQTTFTPPSYTVGFIQVFRNGVLLGSADYTASNGTTVVLSSGATAGDLVTTISFYVSSVLNAIPAVAGSISLAGPYVTGVLPSANLPTGSVLQVVNATYGTQTSNSTLTLADTGLTATITPKFSTSKILVLVDQNCYNGGAAQGMQLTLFRNTTNLVNMGTRLGGDVSSGTVISLGSASVGYLDSPATTSATTYKTQFASMTAGSSVYVSVYNSVSTITLMEIAG